MATVITLLSMAVRHNKLLHLCRKYVILPYDIVMGVQRLIICQFWYFLLAMKYFHFVVLTPSLK